MHASYPIYKNVKWFVICFSFEIDEIAKINSASIDSERKWIYLKRITDGMSYAFEYTVLAN